MVNVVTAADLVRDIVQRVLNEDAKANADFLPPTLLLRWIADAYVEITRRTKLLTATHKTDLLPQGSQPAPDDILDRMVWHDRALRVMDNSGNWTALKERDWTYISKFYPLFDYSPSGNPVDWCWFEGKSTPTILIVPTPSGITAGLFNLDYIQDPGPINRLYDDDTATAGVVQGDATVTFASSISGLLLAGDVFGVKADKSSLPTKWYKIASVSNSLHVELTEVYAEVTDGTALFTTSQVSPLEWARPNLVRYAPSEYVLMKYWQGRAADDTWSKYAQAFEGEIQRILMQMNYRPGLKLQGTDARKNYPAMRRYL